MSVAALHDAGGEPALPSDEETAWRSVLRALIETILAFEHPAFPAIGLDRVEARLIACYPLAGAHGAALRAGLVAFDRSFAAGAGGGARFALAPLAARRAMLRSWARSADPTQRRFYASMKRMVLIPAYGLPELRAAVGYEGPG